ncbi:MAG: DHH family phosphoesterase [Opitutales bacterium]
MDLFFPDHRNTFAEAMEALKGKSIAVIGHVRPDGDCIGSQVGLCRLLNAAGADAVCVNHDPVPRVLKPFVGDTPFFQAEAWEPGPDTVAVTVDCADPKRIGAKLRDAFPEVAFNVDHHISNPGYGIRNIITDHASATGEILAGLALDAGLPVDATTAQAFYIGIATDTGQFRFSATTPQVFEIACRLCALGADPAGAAFHLYENESPAKIRLLQRFLASFENHFDGRVVLGLLPDSAFRESGAGPEDTEGLVDYARAIDGVDIGLLLEERNGAVKGSLRSKEPRFRCDRIAQQFGGGGHACAAGLNLDEPLETVRERVLAAIETQLNTVS